MIGWLVGWLIVYITISELINVVMALSICQGVDVDALLGEVVHHVIPKVFDPLTSECTGSFQSLDYKRSKDCLVLHSDNHVNLSTKHILEVKM